MADNKDIAALTFKKALRKLQERAVELFDKMQGKFSINQIITELMKLDDYALNSLGFKGSIDELMGAYKQSLAGMQMFAEVSEVNLKALMRIENQAWINKSRVEIDTMRREIFNATATKTWNKKAIIKNLHEGIGGALSDKQIETEITTALSNFERNVTSQMMAEMPDDTKYYYLGPQDAKTRDECQAMGNAGELTKKEIISQFGSDVLEIGGGYNCRHRWSLAV